LNAMSPEELAEYTKAQARRGIIYLSRLPPYMKPAKLRHLMEQYGKVGKLFMKPEEDAATKKRKKLGGNKKKRFVEGWVEFEDKKLARQVAESLNGTQISRQKGDFYHDDLWTMLYLPKFKWHHLTERVAYENATRVKKQEAEDSQVRKETNVYLQNVANAKGDQAMRDRRAAKNLPVNKKKDPTRFVRQRQPIKDDS